MLGGIASCIEKYNVIVEGVEGVRNWYSDRVGWSMEGCGYKIGNQKLIILYFFF